VSREGGLPPTSSRSKKSYARHEKSPNFKKKKTTPQKERTSPLAGRDKEKGDCARWPELAKEEHSTRWDTKKDFPGGRAGPRWSEAATSEKTMGGGASSASGAERGILGCPERGAPKERDEETGKALL